MKDAKKNSSWKVNWIKKPKLRKPVLIEGLPGIANVGKIVIDFIIDQKKAIKICEFFSFDLPHIVFIREDNLVSLPKICLYTCKGGNKEDLLFLVGDVQPPNERSCYEFCDCLLELCTLLGCCKIITTGGIGLSKIPNSPRVYSVSNDKKIVGEFTKIAKIERKSFGVVGPLVGVTGLLLGLATEKKIPAIALLAETFAHPMYLGMKGAREILNVLNARFSLKLNLKNLDDEISDIESEILMKTKQLRMVEKSKDQKPTYIG